VGGGGEARWPQPAPPSSSWGTVDQVVPPTVLRYIPLAADAVAMANVVAGSAAQAAGNPGGRRGALGAQV
jgi:hypothetical protein